MRIPRITSLAVLALIAAGCESRETGNEISTNADLVADSGADDALGANMMTDNEAAVALPTEANEQ